MRINIPFGLHAYEDRSLPVNAQKCINYFVEPQPQDSKNPVIVHPTPGSALWITVGNGPIHGMKVMNDVLYVVSGEELYSVTSNGLSTLLGAIIGNRRCAMEHNSVEVCIVNGSKGYIYNPDSGLSEITDENFFPTKQVVYLERRFLFPRTGTRQFFCSDAFSGLTYDGLNFDQLLIEPEKIVSMLADHGEVWLFGLKGTEVWAYNRNEAAFPYSRLDGSFVEKGCAAPFSPAKIDNSFYWLGHDLSIYRAQGYQPVRISTHAIEHKIKSFNHDSAFGLTFAEEGHFFYELTFPDDNYTCRYDAATQLWHEAMVGSQGRYHANANAFFNRQNIIGDYRNGNLYILSLDIYTDGGQPIYRIASSPQIHSGRLRTVMDRLDIDIEGGQGLTTGQGSNPQLMLRYSDDGGLTWSNERWATLGKKGEYAQRARFSNLGAYYQRMFQLTLSDPIKGTIIAAFADVEPEDDY